MPTLRYVLLAALCCIYLLPTSWSKADEATKTITVTHSATSPPFSFIGSDGKPKGILIDLWKEFGKQQGVKVEFALSDWNSTLQLMKYSMADIHAGLFISDSRMKYMSFAKQLNITVPTRLFVSIDSVESPLSGTGNTKIGVVKESYEEQYIKQHYSTLSVSTYMNTKLMIRAALRGEINAFIESYSVGLFYLHSMSVQGQFHATETLYTKPMHAAVVKGDKAFLAFVNKGLNKISQEKFDQIISKWMYRESSTPQWVLPAIVSLFLVLTGTFTLFYIITLRKQVAARRAELMLLNTTDTLTGIYNRKKIDEVFEEEFERFYRYQKPFSIILLDIDHFKSVNDTYGHTVGDEVLTNLSLLISVNIRRTDIVGRWGGEEFLLICPETNKKAATIVAENLRKIIETYGHSPDSPQPITSSFGVTQVNTNDDRRAIFARADQALYQAKNKGRNCVISI